MPQQDGMKGRGRSEDEITWNGEHLVKEYATEKMLQQKSSDKASDESVSQESTCNRPDKKSNIQIPHDGLQTEINDKANIENNFGHTFSDDVQLDFSPHERLGTKLNGESKLVKPFLDNAQLEKRHNCRRRHWQCWVPSQKCERDNECKCCGHQCVDGVCWFSYQHSHHSWWKKDE